ncbi:hypothetical protein EDB80DRAFT_295821 [Ilyonectria destructans]|nr:hypothetical protein EDB80DRAFT_295821 [Ilyonectria destructans]
MGAEPCRLARLESRGKPCGRSLPIVSNSSFVRVCMCVRMETVPLQSCKRLTVDGRLFLRLCTLKPSPTTTPPLDRMPAPRPRPLLLSRSLHPRVERNITDGVRALSSVWLGAYTHLSLCHRRQSRNPASSNLHVSRLRGTAIGSAYLFPTRANVHRLPRLGDPHSELPSSVIHSHQKEHAMKRNHGPWGGVIALGGFLHLPFVGVADLSSC